MRFRAVTLSLAVTCLVPVTGCIRLPLQMPAKSPKPLPEQYASQLPRYDAPPRLIDEKLIESTTSFRIVERNIESFSARWGTNKPVGIECYLPHNTSNAPVILVLPVSGGRNYPLERGYLAPYLADHGYAGILVRREQVKDMMDARQIDSLIIQSVIDNRRIIDWIETRPEFDADRIGALGTSLGSMKVCLLMAADHRVKAGVLALTGCDAPYILAYSKDGALRGGGVALRRQRFLDANHLTRAEFQKLMADNITWDTKYLGEYVDPRKAFLILGALDCVVPFKKGLELRRLMGKPETKIIMSGHYGAALYIFDIRSSALEFFDRKLNKK